MIEVVHAGEADWTRVRTVRLASMQDTPDAFWSLLEEESAQPQQFWRDRLSARDRATFLATEDGADLGTMGVGPHHGDVADAGLYGVWVAGGARGGGAADALLAAVVTWARQRGFARLRLDVGDHNARATAFYLRAGFIPTGHTSTFPAPRDHITEHELALAL